MSCKLSSVFPHDGSTPRPAFWKKVHQYKTLQGVRAGQQAECVIDSSESELYN